MSRKKRWIVTKTGNSSLIWLMLFDGTANEVKEYISSIMKFDANYCNDGSIAHIGEITESFDGSLKATLSYHRMDGRDYTEEFQAVLEDMLGVATADSIGLFC